MLRHSRPPHRLLLLPLPRPLRRQVFLYAIDEQCQSPRAARWRQLLRAGCGGKLALPYLCLDEALDGLDEAGLDGCAEVLAEEARHSLVVVLSHDERVRRGIPFVKHVQL